MKSGKLSLLLLVVFGLSLQAYAQCSNASLNGTFFYTLSGSAKSGTVTSSYAELGQVVADGNGVMLGSTTTSIAGVVANHPLGAVYSINADCSGTITLSTSVESLQFAVQLVNGGGLALISIEASSGATEIGNGRLYRAANATGSMCGTGTLNGTYGALLSGGRYAAAVRTTYEAANQITFDGKSTVTVNGEVTIGDLAGVPWSGTGTYSMNASCAGTAQISSPNGTVNYLIARIAGGTVLFLENDANTTVSGAATAQQFQQVLPQFAFGAGWYSARYFTNTTSTTATFRVTFTADNGTPLDVPGVGSSRQITLAPLQTTIIEALNAGATLIQGYASFSLPVGVTGYGIFRQSAAGRFDQEALVGFKSAIGTGVSLTWDDTNFATSIAIVNPSSIAATVTITAWDSNGNQVGTYSQSLQPGINNKIANELRTWIPGVVGLRGYALFTVTTGSVSVLGLRFGGSAFTSIPTTQDQ